MWRNTQTSLFKILSDRTSVDYINSYLDLAYEEFIERLILYLNTESDNAIRIRTLNLISVDFDMIRATLISHQEKQNFIKLLYSDKVISFLNKELDLIYCQIKFPKSFIKVGSTWKSPLVLNPNKITHIDMMESICGYYYTEGISAINGASVSFKQLASSFEFLFNFKFADIYKKRDEVIKRKPNKRTAFLNHMSSAIIKVSREQGYQP